MNIYSFIYVIVLPSSDFDFYNMAVIDDPPVVWSWTALVRLWFHMTKIQMSIRAFLWQH